ncbi:MAG: hypothetical protein AAFN92_22925, partial [Bacteroidota bacterium]
LQRLRKVIWQNELLDEVYGNFSVFKLSVASSRTGRIQVGVVPMARDKPKEQDILDHLERRFGPYVREQIDIFFPRLNRLKFQK